MIPRRGAYVATLLVAGVLAAVPLVASFATWPSRQRTLGSTSIDPPARQVARGEPFSPLHRWRATPVELQRIPGMEDAVTDRQLVTALASALPMWDPPAVSSLIHELRLWGRHSDFTKAMLRRPRSGEMMVETLLNDRLCRERTTTGEGTFLMDSPYGIYVALAGTRDEIEGTAEGHYGQLLMALGEAGIPLDTSVSTVSGRSGTIADLLHDAAMRFAWTAELEFIAVALALWLPPETTWTNQFGNRYSFDDLMAKLTDIPHGQGACGGTHVPYAIASILNVDRQYPLLTVPVRQRGTLWLTDLGAKLERTQTAGGGWDYAWAEQQQPVRQLWHDSVLDQITITGHHLEWMAIAPPHVRPAPRTIALAVNALTRDIDRLPPVEGREFKTLLPCSHAAKALCQLRGQDSFTVWETFWDQGRLIYDSNRGWNLEPVRSTQ